MGRFFERFSGAAFGGRLARVKVTCRVVQPQALARLLFNQEVAAVFFDDGGNSDIGLPACIHACIIDGPSGMSCAG